MTKDELKKALDSIANMRGGVLIPSEVVNIARDADHPLHAMFEWDDTAAAHKYRLEQARGLIASVRVTVVTTSGTLQAPAYLKGARGGEVYRSAESVRANRADSVAALAMELSNARNAISRGLAVASYLGDYEQTVQEIADMIDLTRDQVANG